MSDTNEDRHKTAAEELRLLIFQAATAVLPGFAEKTPPQRLERALQAYYDAKPPMVEALGQIARLALIRLRRGGIEDALTALAQEISAGSHFGHLTTIVPAIPRQIGEAKTAEQLEALFLIFMEVAGMEPPPKD